MNSRTLYVRKLGKYFYVISEEDGANNRFSICENLPGRSYQKAIEGTLAGIVRSIERRGHELQRYRTLKALVNELRLTGKLLYGDKLLNPTEVDESREDKRRIIADREEEDREAAEEYRREN